MNPVLKFPRAAAALVLLSALCVGGGAGRPAAAALRGGERAGARVVPFAREAGNWIILDTQVNGSRPLPFILDSAASSSVIDLRSAESLRLPLAGSVQVSGAGEDSFAARLASGVALKLPGAELTDQQLIAFPLDKIETYVGHKAGGILGHTLFRNYVVEVDYAARVVRLHDPQGYVYAGTGESFPISFAGNLPRVRARVSLPGREPVDCYLLLDTGAAPHAAMFTRPFDEAHRLSASLRRTVREPLIEAVGGETRQVVGRVGSLRVGRFALDAPVVSFSEDRAGAGGSRSFDGLIGGETLRRFRVIFDYGCSRLILEPNASFAEPFEYNMSGMRVVAVGADLKRFAVRRVLAGSPAALAGLREGDVIESFGGRPAPSLTLTDILLLLKREGTYALSVRRGGETFGFTIRLRRQV